MTQRGLQNLRRVPTVHASIDDGRSRGAVEKDQTLWHVSCNVKSHASVATYDAPLEPLHILLTLVTLMTTNIMPAQSTKTHSGGCRVKLIQDLVKDVTGEWAYHVRSGHREMGQGRRKRYQG